MTANLTPEEQAFVNDLKAKAEAAIEDIRKIRAEYTTYCNERGLDFDESDLVQEILAVSDKFCGIHGLETEPGVEIYPDASGVCAWGHPNYTPAEDGSYPIPFTVEMTV